MTLSSFRNSFFLDSTVSMRSNRSETTEAVETSLSRLISMFWTLVPLPYNWYIILLMATVTSSMDFCTRFTCFSFSASRSDSFIKSRSNSSIFTWLASSSAPF